MVDLDLLAEFVEGGEIVDVRTLSFSATKREEPREGLEEDDVEQSMSVAVGVGNGTIEVRLTANISTFGADYTGVVATQFRPANEVEITEELARDFSTEVGVMTVYPYLRELVQSSSIRLHEPPLVIPLVKRGEVQLTPVDPEIEAGR